MGHCRKCEVYLTPDEIEMLGDLCEFCDSYDIPEGKLKFIINIGAKQFLSCPKCQLLYAVSLKMAAMHLTRCIGCDGVLSDQFVDRWEL